MQKLTQLLSVWFNVYQRIRFFRKMFPLSTIAKDIALFPMHYHNVLENRTIRNVTAVLTHHCNLRCSMCYFHEELSHRAELSLDVYARMLEQIAPTRPCIILSGGEPFTNANILEYARLAKGHGLPVQIFTNGVLATPERVNALTSLGVDYMNFSMLGDPERHDLVAGIPGTYQRMLNNLRYLAANRRSTEVCINFTVTPDSVQYIPHVYDIAKELRLDGVRVQHFNFLRSKEFNAHKVVMAREFCSEAGVNEHVTDDDLSYMAELLIAHKAQYGPSRDYPPTQWAPNLTDEEIRNWYSNEPFKTLRKCLFPWRGTVLDADGKIYPCSKIYLPLGDANTADIFSIWQGETMRKFRSRLKRGFFPSCSRCCKL